MTMRDNILADVAEHTAQEGTGRRRGLLARLSDWIDTCADYYAASVMYEELSRLSDTELKRRGLTRETLARDISVAAARTNASR